MMDSQANSGPGAGFAATGGYRVSVVIPTYNRAAMIREALKSLQLQTIQDFEIIVVDDCSEDDTKQVIEGIEDSRLLYIRHDKNSGGASARNTGIRAATGEFIAFLDSDDQWRPEKLEKQLQVLSGDSGIGAVYTGFNAMNGDLLLWKSVPIHRGELIDRLMAYNCIDTTSSIVVRKELLCEIEGFDESLPSCQDWDLYIRLAGRTRIDFVKEPLVLFQQHPGERITTNNSAVIKGHMLMYGKHKQLAQERGKYVFGKFNLTVGKILLKNGMISRDKKTVKLSREVLKEALATGGYFPKHLLLYGSTFVHLALLNMLYVFSKKRAKGMLHFFGSAS